MYRYIYQLEQQTALADKILNCTSLPLTNENQAS